MSMSRSQTVATNSPPETLGRETLPVPSSTELDAEQETRGGSRRGRSKWLRRAPVGARSGFVIPSLNGIRALSVAVVFFGHAGLTRLPAPLGVTIFFFLSGYLITTLLRMEFEKTGTISFRAFYLRRAFRILPPVYLVLGLAYTLTRVGALGAQKLRLGAGLAQVFFLSNYQILRSGWDGPHSGRPLGTGDLWSLAIEEHFYLLFPLFYLLLCRYLPQRRRQAIVLGGICAMVLAWRCVLMFGLHASFDRTYIGTDTRIDSILFGCILAIWANPFLDRGEPGARFRLGQLWAPLLAPVSIVALALAAGVVSVNRALYLHLIDPRIAGTFQYTIEGLALIPLFVVAVRYHTWGPMKLLNLRAVAFIGGLSYSIYITHQIIISAAHQHLPPGRIERGVVYVGITLLVAWGIFSFVERPFARMRRRLSKAGATA
jgi:peptidoglycan/LPS O-acetylase OafA/YrhL